MSDMITLTPAQARRKLIVHFGLDHYRGQGAAGTRAVLKRLRCIQLDPLDAIGTNADLVVMARVDGARPGDVWRHLFPGRAFEHFAKERCILPAEVFAHYRSRGHAAQTRWWRHEEREQRLPPAVIHHVLRELQEGGPMTARELTDHGLIDAIDWSGWTGTTKATSMALELLWTRCDVVVCGRNEAGMKLYDTPERALGSIRAKASGQSAEQFSRWALLERVEAAGLLSRSGSATWSMLSDIRESGMVDELIRSGELIEVMIEGSSRRYLTLPSFPATRSPRFDDRVRILGPLDPLIWDRQLIRTTFDFDYVWEVYKPEHMRRWGWYVSPLLHRDELIGRIEARIADGLLIVKKLWLERVFDPEPVRTAIERHAERSGCSGIRMKKITPAKTSRL